MTITQKQTLEFIEEKREKKRKKRKNNANYMTKLK